MKEEKITLQKKKIDLIKLVMLMNRQNRRFFPPFAAMLKVIDYVLTEEELDLLLRLGTNKYSYEQAAAKSNMNSGKFKLLFESLKQKGFIKITCIEKDKESYSLNPFVVGWLEVQLPYLIGKPEEKEFARRWIGFFNSMRNKNFFPLRNIINMWFRLAPASNQSVGFIHEAKDAKGKSIININHTINVPDSKIYPTNSVTDLILEQGTKSVIGQLTCPCRKLSLAIDNNPCRFNILHDDEGCLGFGDMVKAYIKNGTFRQISKEQALDVIQKTRDKGAIHTVFHENDDTGRPQIGICNCCWDCCEILGSYNKGALPLRYSCFYMAKITDSTKCTGCKKCEKYCPTAAISIVDKKISIDTKKCLGCGQCVHQCSFSAVELIENKRTAFLPMLKKSEARIKVKQYMLDIES